MPRSKLYNTLSKILVLSLSGLINSLHALPDDRYQPINIQADTAEQSRQDGKEKTIYRGRVTMIQGSLHIYGSQVTIYTQNHAVAKIIAEGLPAQFSQQTDVDTLPIVAKAERISYDLASDNIIMIVNASMTQGASIVSGERIDYNIATNEVKAAGNDDSSPQQSTGPGRVNIILEPKQKPAAPALEPTTPEDPHGNAVSH